MKSPWDNSIKITKSLKFTFEDLMRSVDTDYEFTLRDVLRAVVKAKVPLEILKEMLHCRYIDQYWEEAKSKRFKDSDDRTLEYLELYWLGDKSEEDGRLYCSSSWEFHGVGKAGDIPKDIVEHSSKEEVDKLKKEGYRQDWAIEFSPMYELANYPIKICSEMIVLDYITKYKPKDLMDMNKKVEFKPSITLIELLYGIFWELSWSGSPAQRDERREDLHGIVDKIKEASENDTLDVITTPWEEVKEKLLEKFKEPEE